MVEPMNLKKIDDEWWFEDLNNPDPEYVLTGPYSTKKEAEDGMRGLARTWRMLDMPRPTSRRKKNNLSEVPTPEGPSPARPMADTGSDRTGSVRPVQCTLF